MTVLQKLGVVTAIVSMAAGFCGVVWSIYPAFVSESDADYAAAATRDIANDPIWFSIVAVAGTAMGAALFIVGRKRD